MAWGKREPLRRPPTAMLHWQRSALLRGAQETPGGGVVTFHTWEQLADVLYDSGTIRRNEAIRRFVIEDRGISIYLETT